MVCLEEGSGIQGYVWVKKEIFYRCNSYLLQGNKITVLSEKHIASWTMLTELNACNNIEFFLLSFVHIKGFWDML